jgi:hypothetical protein
VKVRLGSKAAVHRLGVNIRFALPDVRDLRQSEAGQEPTFPASLSLVVRLNPP